MIPDWNSAAVLPPIRPGQPGHSPDRSPYRVSLVAVVERFATSPERILVLRGLLAYRAALSLTPIAGGFQWLDGSFIEHKEALVGEAPKDVDVVTFYQLPDATVQDQLVAAYPTLFDHGHVKKTYLVDGYTHQIGLSLEAFDVRQISYWYSMWSHRRDEKWKGFVQVELSSSEDLAALALLDQIEREGATR
jgi:hypothetical protein